MLAGTFLLTAGSLLFEVSLTRLLSLIHYSGFVFMVLSLALLGLGLGAALAALLPELRRPERTSLWAALAAVSAALAVAATGLLANSGPAVLLLILPPFLFTGMTLSSLFSHWPASSHRLYWADLLGAGSGTLLALPLLGVFSPTLTALLAALLLVSAAVTLGPRRPYVFLAALALLPLPLLAGQLEPDLAGLAAGKPLSGELAAGAEVVLEASDAFASSHLIKRADGGAHYLYVDGAAGSLVPLQDDPALRADIGYLPFRVLQPDSVFLLGPGGGLDASLARLAGTDRIVAAELNGAGLELVEQVSSSGYGGVELYVDEGRSVLRRLGTEFDLIMLAHVITQSSDLRGFALSEASTYTLEAFTDYLEHLAPGGVIALKLYDEPTLSRAFFTAYTALAGAGVDEPGNHLLALLDQSGPRPLPLLVVSGEPLEREAVVTWARAAEQMNLGLLYLPGLLTGPPLDRLADGRATVIELVAEAKQGGLNLEPVTDSRPFFFQFETGLPAVFQPVALVAGLLLLASVLLFAFSRRPAHWPAAPAVFALLGAGFMSLQLGFIQRSQLFVGHPTLALSLVLAVMLLGGGLGSLLGERQRRPLLWAPLFTVLLTLAWHFAWPQLASALQGSPTPVRVLTAIVALLPVSLFLGMQLPAGLRQLAAAPGRVAGAWAVNGVFSVIGSVATVLLALIWGYQAALLLGVTCYLLVLLLSLRLPARS